jgi:hypothetical protein
MVGSYWEEVVVVAAFVVVDVVGVVALVVVPGSLVTVPTTQ